MRSALAVSWGGCRDGKRDTGGIHLHMSAILGSAPYLRLSLVCTNGTPVANILQLSPPLPLTVDYRSENGITGIHSRR